MLTPRKILPLFAAGLTFVCTSLAGTAATYYVSASGGDDGNPGTQPAPWRTLAKVSGTTFVPGDSILFKRGETWTGETLTVSSSGQADARITYGAYGAGARPVVDRGTGSREPGILISGKRYVTVQDFDVRRGDSGVRCMADSAQIELIRIDVADSKGPGIVMRQSSFVLVDGCTVTRAGNNGILMHGSVAEPKVNHCIVRNCIVSDLGSNDGIVIHQDMAGNGAGSDFVFRHNIVFNCPEQGFDITTGTHVLLEDNVTYGNHGGAIVAGHIASNVTIRRHFSQDEPTSGSNSLIIQVPSVTVEHSRFLGPVNPNPAKNVSIVGIQIASNAEPEDVRLRNNVFLWNSTRPGILLRTSNGGFKDAQGVPKRLQLQRLEIKNNIFASRTATPGALSFRDLANPLTSPGFVFDHNLYHSPDPAGMKWTVDGEAHDFAGYRAAFGKDAHGLEADPKFASSALGDFRLQADSPAIDAGAAIAGLAGSDAAGLPQPQGRATDVGAYEFILNHDALPPPVNLSAPPLARTATTAVLLWDRPAGGKDIPSYQIFCDGELVGETTRLSFTARNLTPGRMHRLAVRSCRPQGICSRESDPVVVLTRSAGPVLDVREHGARGDGATKDVLIVGCRFGNQDDSIAIKSGAVFPDQPRRQRSSENITIRDCLVDGSLAPGSHPLGFAVGSENCGGIRHVLIQDCVFRNAASVANLKSNRTRLGAVVEDIRVENCVYTNTEWGEQLYNRAPLAIDLFYYRDYGSPDSVAPLTPATPVFRDIHFKNIAIENRKGRFAYFCGLIEQPAQNITLENVTGTAKTGLQGQNLDGITLRNVVVTPQEGEPFVWINTRNRVVLPDEPVAAGTPPAPQKRP